MNEYVLIIIGFVALLIDNIMVRAKVSSIKRNMDYCAFLISLLAMSDEEEVENLKVENVKFERMTEKDD